MATAAQRKHLDRVTRLVPGFDPWKTAVDCHFDYDKAQLALDFFPECLTHVKGEWAGQALVLEDWQQAIIANCFGWIRPDGSRRFRSVFLYVPRKNAKTTLAAGIAVYLTYCDGEPGAEVYSAAANEEQAGICFATAKGMVLQNPALKKRSDVFRKSISYGETLSAYTVLTAKAATKHGLNPHGVILDELHAHKDRELADTLTTAVGSRRQPLIVYTTTADYGHPSICNETYDYACKVRDGVIDDMSHLPVIYEATREDDWGSEDIWKKANPNYGISVKPDFIRAAYKKAKDSPANENSFKRLHLNIITEQVDRWIQLDKWDNCIGDVPWDKLREALRGQTCFGGLDLASTQDLACFNLTFSLDGLWLVLPFFWCPRSTAREREKRDRVPYIHWAQLGALKMTDGDVIDYDVIRRDINDLGKLYDIEEIAIDRWAAAQITNQLTQDGFEMVPFGMGFASLSGPTKELEKNVIAGTLRHGGHPVLRWNASNVAIERDAMDNIKPSKKHSTEKIDGIMATVMSIGRLTAQELKRKSIYSTRGLATT